MCASEKEWGIALVGNPGVGKSTILNGIAGECCFKSGNSYVSSMTKTLYKKVINGKLLIDTPGLADIKRGKEAGKELDILMKKGWPLKLVFVVALESGRARAEDANTIHAVLSAIKSKHINDRFGVIINNVSKGVFKLLKDKENWAILRRKLLGEYRTSHWCIVETVNKLTDNTNQKLINIDLLYFFADLDVTKGKNVNVSRIDTDQSRQKLKKHEEYSRKLEERFQRHRDRREEGRQKRYVARRSRSSPQAYTSKDYHYIKHILEISDRADERAKERIFNRKEKWKKFGKLALTYALCCVPLLLFGNPMPLCEHLFDTTDRAVRKIIK